MNLDSAVSKHGEWKIKLRTAIARNEKLEQFSISRDNNCELGKWLHGEAKTKYGNLSTYRECVEKHAKFHTEVGKIASVINAGRKTEAEAMLGVSTPFSTASQNVGLAIMRLKREINS